MLTEQSKRRLGERFRRIPANLDYPRPEPILTRTDVSRTLRQMRSLGLVSASRGVTHYDPWYYWRMEYDANPRRYYTAKFEPGVKVCRCCDNFRWSVANKFLASGLCKECSAESNPAAVVQPATTPTAARPIVPECLLRARYQSLMSKWEQQHRSCLPKTIRIISTEQVIAEKLALEAVGSKSL